MLAAAESENPYIVERLKKYGISIFSKFAANLHAVGAAVAALNPIEVHWQFDDVHRVCNSDVYFASDII